MGVAFQEILRMLRPYATTGTRRFFFIYPDIRDEALRADLVLFLQI